MSNLEKENKKLKKENKKLKGRLEHLLKSKRIRLYDKINPKTKKYELDIEEFDAELRQSYQLVDAKFMIERDLDAAKNDIKYLLNCVGNKCKNCDYRDTDCKRKRKAIAYRLEKLKNQKR